MCFTLYLCPHRSLLVSRDDVPLRRPDPEAVRHPRGLDLDGGAEEGAVAAAAGEVLKGFYLDFIFAGIASFSLFF